MPAPYWIALSGVFGAVFGALVSGGFSYMTQERQLDVKLVEIGISILRAPAGEDVSAIREWALDLIERRTGTKFKPDQKTALIRRPLAIVEMNTEYETARRAYTDTIAAYQDRLKTFESAIKNWDLEVQRRSPR
jgi:hypothetical protein